MYLDDSGFWKLKLAKPNSWVVFLRREDSVDVMVCDNKAEAESNIADFHECELNDNDSVDVLHNGKFHSWDLQVVITVSP